MNKISHEKPSKRILIIISLLLFSIACLIYLPSLQNDFVWDDEKYLLENTHIHSLNTQSLRWMFTSSHSSNWHPLTWFSHTLDYTLWGLQPHRHRLINIIFHALNTFLVFLLIVYILSLVKSDPLKPTQKLIAGVVTSLLFALHPMHVESVAWIAERKDLLSAFFYLLSLLSYLSYVSCTSHKHKTSRFTLSIILFVLALMSKPMAVSLPLILFLLDCYPLERFKWRAPHNSTILLEKVPFLVLSGVSSVITIIAQRLGGSIHSLEQVNLGYRLLNSLWAITLYLKKMVLPFRLSPFYPFTFYPYATYLIPAIIFSFITFFCLRMVKNKKCFWLCCWLYFLITLLPVLGIVQVGGQAAADRYTYLPSLGPFLLAGLGMVWIKKRFSLASLLVATCLVMLPLGYLTTEQIKVWRTSETLWECVINLYPETPVAYYNLGTFYGENNRLDEAISQLKNAIAINPDYKEVHNNLGVVYYKQGKIDEAIAEYKSETEINPRFEMAYNNLGLAYYSKGLLDKAAAFYEQAIALNPHYASAYHNLGTVYQRKGRLNRAISCYEQAIKNDPAFDKSHNNLGFIYESQRKLNKAITHYKQAVTITPAYSDAHFNLGNAYNKKGNLKEAIVHYRQAIVYSPNYIKAYYNLGNMYAKSGDLDKAINQYKQAVAKNPRFVEAYNNLGVAYSKQGKWGEAIKEYKKALTINPNYKGAINNLNAALKMNGVP
jgi:tetratricopeptide (TPR) repeat protein